MSVKDYVCKLVDRNTIKSFVETHHYSRSIRSVTCNYCFGLYDGDKLIGSCIYGRPAFLNQLKRYNKEHPELVMELRRLCCLDDTLKNTESYFISKTLRWLKNNSNIEYIISYADTRQGHRGVIYQATSFEYLGTTVPLSSILYEGKLFHKRCLDHKRNGDYTDRAKSLRNGLLSGDAVWSSPMVKHIYLFDLKKRRK